MATAVVSVTTSLDVTSKYQSLVDKLVQDDASVYLHTIEKLEALILAGDLASADKANLIGKVLSDLNTSIVGASLQTALAWSKAEKDAEFQKVELAEKIGMVRAQVTSEEAKKKQIDAERVNISSQARRMYGAATVDATTGLVTSLSNDGKVYYEIDVLKQQYLNDQQTEKVLKGKVRESQAAVYKIVADTRANFGNATISLSDVAATITLTETDTMSYWQKQIAQKQADGYGYNAWANAVNASSTMLGTLIGSEIDSVWGTNADANPTKVGNRILSKLETGLTQLLDVK